MKKKYMIPVLAIAILRGAALAVLKPWQEKKPEKYSTMIFDVFNTAVSFVSYQDSQEDFDRLTDLLENRYKELNQLYDIYNDYPGINNIKTINDNAGVAPVKVSREIIDLLEFAKEWYSLSDGKLNIAMGSVLVQWHDFRENYKNDPSTPLPNIERLKAAREHADINSIEIDRENMTVYITDPDTRIDVGAVAKGFATEIICDELNARCDNYVLSAGGNVKCHGRPKDNRTRWAVGLQNPLVDENFDKQEGSIATAYFNEDMSLVCSGGYERYVVVDGRRYHHIIDPITLYPEEVYRGVAIFCEDSGMADAMSTAIFLSTPEYALEFANRMGVDCMLIMPDGTIHATEGTSKYLASRGVTRFTE